MTQNKKFVKNMADHKSFKQFFAKCGTTTCKHCLYYDENHNYYSASTYKWCIICNVEQSTINNDGSKNANYIDITFEKYPSCNYIQIVKSLLKYMLHLKYLDLNQRFRRTLTIIARQLFKHKRIVYPNYYRFKNKNKLHYNYAHKYIANNIYFIL
jgi:hypothetical protein